MSDPGPWEARSDPRTFGSQALDDPSLQFAKEHPRQRWWAVAVGLQIWFSLVWPKGVSGP